jgi:hypothetical protein
VWTFDRIFVVVFFVISLYIDHQIAEYYVEATWTTTMCISLSFDAVKAIDRKTFVTTNWFYK